MIMYLYIVCEFCINPPVYCLRMRSYHSNTKYKKITTRKNCGSVEQNGIGCSSAPFSRPNIKEKKQSGNARLVAMGVDCIVLFD